VAIQAGKFKGDQYTTSVWNKSPFSRNVPSVTVTFAVEVMELSYMLKIVYLQQNSTATSTGASLKAASKRYAAYAYACHAYAARRRS
jgi:hypothetical protein